MRRLTEAVLAGANDDMIEGVEVVARPALEATADDVLAADGYLLGTPANFGYMSGALKHFFDIDVPPDRRVAVAHRRGGRLGRRDRGPPLRAATCTVVTTPPEPCVRCCRSSGR